MRPATTGKRPEVVYGIYVTDARTESKEDKGQILNSEARDGATSGVKEKAQNEKPTKNDVGNLEKKTSEEEQTRAETANHGER